MNSLLRAICEESWLWDGKDRLIVGFRCGPEGRTLSLKIL
jgi:hypothetical protein